MFVLASTKIYSENYEIKDKEKVAKGGKRMSNKV